MASTVVKRSIVVDRHKTSISIEDVFWVSLKEIAGERGSTLSDLVASIDEARGRDSNLSSAIRVFILDYFRAKLDSMSDGSSGPRSPSVFAAPGQKTALRR